MSFRVTINGRELSGWRAWVVGIPAVALVAIVSIILVIAVLSAAGVIVAFVAIALLIAALVAAVQRIVSHNWSSFRVEEKVAAPVAEYVPIHLRPMGRAEVHDLCDRAERAAPESFSVRVAARRFRESRTPWDATRLADALADCPGAENLVRQIDILAHERAGLVPAPRRRA